MILYEAIKYKYPDAVPRQDFELRNDGAGSYIEEWKLQAPLPTEEELQRWWEESQMNPSYNPPDQLELLATELSKEKLARKRLEESNEFIGKELTAVKLKLLSLKGENQE
ncbi:XkdW family protein [Bacillus sp. NPDC077027]|uniref:XkdW family protein n=1 Tax=Bacillus sp. NPDC077027 TaxID=3390548 RepID=UPI003D057AF3